MDSFFTRYKNSLVLIAVLLAQTIGLAIQVRRPVESDTPDARSVLLLRYWAVSAVTPFERFFLNAGHALRYGWSNYIDLRSTRRQNAALQQQLAQLRVQQAAIAEDALQGHRLQALLDFKQHYVARTVAAQVIGTSGTEVSRIIYIDKGAADGLKTDQAVITPDGIVGKLRDVFPHTAQVLLIDDQTSGAGVLLANSRVRAIVRGTTTGRVVINNLTPDSRIKPGEKVLTSGGDQVYPRGLPVGTIQSIAPDPDHQPYTLIQVIPAANLAQLEEVLVITGTQTDLPVQAQHDLAVGAATARAQAEAAAARAAELKAIEDAKSAAETVADRLPSLHDPNAPPVDPTKPAPPEPIGGKVRALPTLRPDRYTPGSTPPAADLTPGAAHSNENPATTPPASAPRKTTEPSPETPPPAKRPAPETTPTSPDPQ
jgi:rod shape-determining protein MreC